MMRSMMVALDRHMRRKLGVFEFSNHPDCIFRLSIDRAQRRLRVQDGTIEPGEKILLLHFWNEQLPTLPPGGPDMPWAVGGVRQLAASCRMLARYLRDEPAVSDARAVGGSTVLFVPGDGSGGERVFTRLGFVVSPDRNPLGVFGQFWENLYTWMLMRTFNQVTLRRHRLLRMRRTAFWSTLQEFVSRWDGHERAAAPRRLA